jgi:maleate cis-trans isomerase
MLRETTPEALEEMDQGVEHAAMLIKEVTPHAVIFACTSGSFIKGPGSDEEIKSTIEKITEAPAIVASTSMVKGLKHLQIERVALATPYRDEVTDLEVKFLEGYGFRIVSSKGLGLSGAPIRDQDADVVSHLIREVDRPEAQGIFVSCSNFRALEVLYEMENMLSKPVLSANQVLLWDLLVTLNYTIPIIGYGNLLERL